MHAVDLGRDCAALTEPPSALELSLKLVDSGSGYKLYEGRFK